MKKLFTSVLASVALITPAWAARQIVTLDVPDMTCPVCPITVKKALGKVPGVTQIDVHYEQKQATVTFDDAKTNVEALVKATTDAGYPSHPIKEAVLPHE